MNTPGESLHRENLFLKSSPYWLLVPLATQILPLRIRFLDERDLLFAPPPLQLLLATDRLYHLAVGLVVQKPVNIMLFGKSRKGMVLMLPEAEGQVAGNANVQRAAEAADNVNRVAMFTSSS